MKQHVCAFSGRTGSEARGGSDDVAGVFSDHAANEVQTASTDSGMEKAEASVSALLKKLQDAVTRIKSGGEIPCHFTTLTTAIYHWQDLAKILERYEAAVTERRHGRLDPLEPSERKLSAERRRVLKYPGVVAWYTGYKMELFYKHVLKYEDGEGVFEWGAGGIMHLHSINFGSQMPRVDPAQDEWRLPCEESVRMAEEFARVHEEYVTDWSLTKAEKWSQQDIENAAARRTGAASPIHSDAESDGSEDLGVADERTTVGDLEPKRKRARVMEEEAQLFQPARVSFLTAGADESRKQQHVQVGLDADVFCQHDLKEDADFVRVFPTATSMAYVKDAAGRRQVRVLTGSEKSYCRIWTRWSCRKIGIRVR